jgi:hypothetical protein
MQTVLILVIFNAKYRNESSPNVGDGNIFGYSHFGQWCILKKYETFQENEQ